MTNNQFKIEVYKHILLILICITLMFAFHTIEMYLSIPNVTNSDVPVIEDVNIGTDEVWLTPY